MEMAFVVRVECGGIHTKELFKILFIVDLSLSENDF
jgi:hypothetical protein